MIRPRRDVTLMGTAHLWADQSTCTRQAVGAVITIERRIIATGYNGAPAGMPHCNHTCPCQEGFREAKSIADTTTTHTAQCPLKPCRLAVHAEANAIAFAARHGVSTAGGSVHTTLSPCYACAQLIINAGLARVVFDQPYRDRAGVKLLMDAGLLVERLGMG